MDLGEIIALVGVLVVGIGLIASLKDRSKKDIEDDTTYKEMIKNKVSYIEKEISSDDHGLLVLSQRMSEFQQNCARTSTGLAGKVSENSHDIDDLKRAASNGRRINAK